MLHPLEDYRNVADYMFIIQTNQNFYTKHLCDLSLNFYVEKEEQHDRLYITGFNIEGNEFEGYVTFTSYLLSEYDRFEKESRGRIDTAIMAILDQPKQQVFIKNILHELQSLIKRLINTDVEEEHEGYKSMLLGKMSSFSIAIQDFYLELEFKPRTSTPKIQWLESTNILTTLFHDLLNGQKKTRKGENNTKPFLKAKLTDIENLLISNFLDSNGKPFSRSTLKTYLNNSRPETRVAEGGRIELNFQ